ncbi:hypothetical protein A678_05106 [Salmonella enterica subsp. enterica serovar Enteritidis str. 2010K-0271]|nr:hypothetical protein A678_05106 [Salmonella enterica subsp. enterica serovar Enteritidis str. 2010K-0271]
MHTVSHCGRTCRGRRNCRNMNGERRYLSDRITGGQKQKGNNILPFVIN